MSGLAGLREDSGGLAPMIYTLKLIQLAAARRRGAVYNVRRTVICRTGSYITKFDVRTAARSARIICCSQPGYAIKNLRAANPFDVCAQRVQAGPPSRLKSAVLRE